MPAHRSVDRFETGHHGSGELATPGFARQAALVVAVMAALLAVATFLSNEAVKEVITGETGRADTSSRLESNQLKIDVAAGNATMLKVLADGPHDEAEAVLAAAAHERPIQRELAPPPPPLVEGIHPHEENPDHHNHKNPPPQ